MSPLKVACPGCHSELSATPPFPLGLKVKCSRCGTYFALPGPVAVCLHPAAASNSGPIPVAVGVTPPPRRAETPSAGRTPWGVIAAALAMLLFVGGGFVVFAMWRDKARNNDNELSYHAPSGTAEVRKSDPRPAPLPLSVPEDEAIKPPLRHFEPPDERGRTQRPAEPSSAPTALAPKRQQAVNNAIDRGVAYLKRKQKSNGTWATSGHPVGNAALPGLTLLECGVPASDPAVRKAAAFVREQRTQLAGTYELALAVLFLERLGEAEDRPLVQELALRLIAGQLSDGGWSYRCVVVEEAQQQTLLQYLERLRSDSPAEFSKLIADTPSSPESKPAKPNTARAKGKRGKATGELKHVPALQEPLEVRHDPNSPTADNSNTQFAILALWAAQRQGVPVERSLALVAKRFRPCQNDEGGWGYHSGGKQRSPSSASMTCVGLLGLAVGHGLAGDAASERGTVADPQIEKAMHALGTRVGHPTERGEFDLYFLWSLERVGVLYGLQKIGGGDWYAWGVDLLLGRQAKEGNWHDGAYHGATQTLDTCFALLFLKRANLTQDLTKKIEFLKIAPQAEP